MNSRRIRSCSCRLSAIWLNESASDATSSGPWRCTLAWYSPWATRRAARAISSSGLASLRARSEASRTLTTAATSTATVKTVTMLWSNMVFAVAADWPAWTISRLKVDCATPSTPIAMIPSATEVTRMASRETRAAMPRGRHEVRLISSGGSLDGAISGATHGRDIARAIGLLAKFVAQPADMDVDRALQGVALHRPVQGDEQNLSGEYSAFGLHQCREKAELGRRQGDDSVATSQFEPVEVDREVAVPDRAAVLRPSRRALGAAEDGFDAHDELSRGEGLDEIIVRAFVDAVDAVGGRSPRRKNHDRNLGALAHDSHQGQSIELREHQVEHD